MLDWIFEGIVKWVAGVASELMDTVSGLFLNALGTDMTAMEEYFPFVTKAFTVMQYCSWAILFLITVWQLFRVFGGPITEAENPLTLIARNGLFAVLIAYAKPIFLITLDIARAPYTALLEISMAGEDFTFAGVEETLSNGIANFVAITSVIGTLLILILLIALGWNYFKLLLETVERYVVVGVLCYTSPLAFSMGASKATSAVFKSWCRMVGSQLLLLTMNVWFLRGFSTSVGQFIGNGGALSNGNGSIFLWLFCALAFLKTAQRFDSYLASLGLNVAQTGSSMGMEMLMAAKVLSGAASGAKSAGKAFHSPGSGGWSAASSVGTPGSSFATGFASKFKGNSYVRDAVVAGGTPLGAGGGMGFVGRAFGGMAARNGATLTGESISSVASRQPSVSGSIGGEIADRSLGNYIPQMSGYQLQGTSITGGQISTTAVGADGKSAEVAMFSTAQYEAPSGPHSVVTASDSSQWYQLAAGPGQERSLTRPHSPAAPARTPRLRRPSPARMRAPCSARWERALWRQARRRVTAFGITRPITTSRTLPTPSCSPQTAWIGTLCSRTLRPRSSRPASQLWPTIRPSSRRSCQVSSRRSPMWTALPGRTDILRYGMRMARGRCSLTPPATPRPVVTTRCMRTSRAVSGTLSPARLPWSVGRYTRTASRSMTMTSCEPRKLRRFAIRTSLRGMPSHRREL